MSSVNITLKRIIFGEILESVRHYRSVRGEACDQERDRLSENLSGLQGSEYLCWNDQLNSPHSDPSS